MARLWRRVKFLLVAAVLGLAAMYMLEQHTLTSLSLSKTASLFQPYCVPGGSLQTDTNRNTSYVQLELTSLTITKQNLCTKTVLMHTFPYWYELKPTSRVFDRCIYPCLLLLEAERTLDADCVVFFSSYSTLKTPPTRRPKSVWVYFAVESPIHSSNAVFGDPAWHGQFNWTMTYRRDSDIYFGYGDLHRWPVPQLRQDLVYVYRNKTKMVAWFVSHCETQSNREKFVETLKNFITVDVYGQCGDKKCTKDSTACMDMLSRDYYFYMSFENSLCVDYVTEKLYHIMKQVDIIPVVWGGANYSSLLPKNSIIVARDFPSAKALADFLQSLAHDETAYLRYFEWKKDWQVIEPMPLPFCDLCARVHNQHKYAKVYDNVDKWWTEGMCTSPPEIISS